MKKKNPNTHDNFSTIWKMWMNAHFSRVRSRVGIISVADHFWNNYAGKESRILFFRFVNNQIRICNCLSLANNYATNNVMHSNFIDVGSFKFFLFCSLFRKICQIFVEVTITLFKCFFFAFLTLKTTEWLLIFLPSFSITKLITKLMDK